MHDAPSLFDDAPEPRALDAQTREDPVEAPIPAADPEDSQIPPTDETPGGAEDGGPSVADGADGADDPGDPGEDGADDPDDPREDEEDDSEDDEEGANGDEGVSFASLGLPEDILAAVTDMGYRTPTPIQEQAIPALLDLRDVVGIAQTGTGKTAAFGLPMLAIVEAAEKRVQSLVLAPTRELALQSAQAIEDFAAQSRGLDVVAVYGGSPYGPQIAALKKGAQVVVGTPGRVIDLIEKGALDLSGIRMLVLDEADEMLRMGFAEDVETIASSAPAERLTALFSATMPAAIERVANTHLTDPVRIAVSDESSTVDTIHQTYAVVPYKHKIGALTRVLATRAQHIAEGQEEADAAIVFVRTRADVEEISLEMAARGFRAAGISGDVAQAERERMVERLRSGTLDVLVATDVAARGLDVERISLVVNFDVPREPEAYVHRIGRTGRAGRAGRSLTFFTPREHGRLRRIEKLTGAPMEEVAIPSPAAVSEFRARRLLEGVGRRIKRGRLDMYKSLLADLRVGDGASSDGGGGVDVVDVAAALLAQAVGDEGPAPRIDKDRRGPARTRREEEVDESGEFLGASFEGGRDKDRPLKPGRDRKRSASRPSVGAGIRYRVEVGKKDRVKPGSIVGAIAGEGGVDGKDIGHIEIFPTFSLVEISGDLSEDQMRRIGKGYVQGRPLRIRVDEGPGQRGARDRRPGWDRSERGEGVDRPDPADREGRAPRDREGAPTRHRSVRSERWEREIRKGRDERYGEERRASGARSFKAARAGRRERDDRGSTGRAFGTRPRHR
ncbi:DEAD/DEAH box helicase [Actinomyces sp. B33]|uniref:DEAD/DEAH box helicase n=1 Tax=Actinomyces sp. B33 TaxID=2942131 RepID=UPI00233F9952|nr:DEAD/DEAH box helicase [Actinomyces sp. B33]MDC4233236.1 DEAD/DEAH box helicase [Actinomyces sp. B33]